MRDILSDKRTLRILFALFLLMTVGFSVIVHVFQFSVIDGLYDAEKINAHLDAMTPAQKQAHAWMTATLDVVYPFVYGSLFIGTALRFFGRLGPLLSVPSIAVIPMDIAEGVVQVLLLKGHENVVGLKEVITPIKLSLFFLGLLISMIGFCIGIYRLIRRKPG